VTTAGRREANGGSDDPKFQPPGIRTVSPNRVFV
jgi:hypothetical protein